MVDQYWVTKWDIIYWKLRRLQRADQSETWKVWDDVGIFKCRGNSMSNMLIELGRWEWVTEFMWFVIWSGRNNGDQISLSFPLCKASDPWRKSSFRSSVCPKSHKKPEWGKSGGVLNFGNGPNTGRKKSEGGNTQSRRKWNEFRLWRHSIWKSRFFCWWKHHRIDM